MWSRAVLALSLSVGLAAGAALPAAAAQAPAPGSTPSTSAAEPGTTWALQPAADDGPDGRVSLRHVLDGGSTATDLVAVTNFGDRPARFAVYASDGTITSDGNFDLLPPGQAAVGAGTWISLTPVEDSTARDGGGVLLDVPAATTVTLPVQIEVPPGATPGDHPAGVVAELVPPAGGGVQLASRVGVRVHLRVAGDVVARLAPEAVTASYSPSWNPFARGTVTVELDVSNAGNVRVGSETTASVAGPFGLAPARAARDQREVLPGQVSTTAIEVPVTPLFFSWGRVDATPSVVGEDEVDAALVPGAASFTVWTVPWSQLLLLALLVGAVLLVRLVRRRNAADVQAKIDAAVAAATASQRLP